MGMLTGKVALITGASSGIGRATAVEFAEQGAKLVLGDVDAAGGAETEKLVSTLMIGFAVLACLLVQPALLVLWGHHHADDAAAAVGGPVRG